MDQNWNVEEMANQEFNVILTECMSAYADENDLDKKLGCMNGSFGFETTPRTLKRDFANYFNIDAESLSKQVECVVPKIGFYDNAKQSTCTRIVLYEDKSEQFYLVDCDMVDNKFCVVWAAIFSDSEISYIIRNLEELKVKYIINKEKYVASQGVKKSNTF